MVKCASPPIDRLHITSPRASYIASRREKSAALNGARADKVGFNKSGNGCTLRRFLPFFKALPHFFGPSFLSFGLHSSRQSAGRPPVARVSNDSRENFCISIPGARQQCTPLSHTHTLTRSLSSSLMQERTHHKNDEGRRTDSGVPTWVLNRMRACA